MALTGARKDYAIASMFRVEIDNMEGATFTKCAGLKSESEVFEYQEGGDNESVRKLVGPTKASNIVLTKGHVSDPGLFTWRDEIAAGGTKAIKRRNGAVIALAHDGKTELGRWTFTKAWPVRWEMTEFDSNSNQASCELLELAVEKITKSR